MSAVMDSKNGTFNDTSSSVLYYGVNGFRVTWDYFLINIVLFFVAGAGIILNAIALKIVSTKSPLRDVSHNFISHLAMSDIFVGLICIYTVLYDLTGNRNYYECCFRTGIVTCISLNSSIHLLLITFDRYFKIKHPFKYIKYFSNEKRLRLLSVSTWLFAATLGLLPILRWRRPPIHGVEYCSYFGVLPKQYLIFMTSLYFTILFIMLYCYISIVYVACKRRNSQSDGDKVARSNSQRRKAVWWGPTRTMIILITLYLCCWMPTGNFPRNYLINWGAQKPDGRASDYESRGSGFDPHIII